MIAFETPLTPSEEVEFQKWKSQYAPQDSGVDYDLRGAFKAGLKPDSQTGHWPDTFKKPNHPFFSNESQYAPLLEAYAGHWEGDKFVPPGTTLASMLGLNSTTPMGPEQTVDPELMQQLRNFQFKQPQALPQNTGGEAVMGTIADIFANNAASKNLVNRQEVVRNQNALNLDIQTKQLDALATQFKAQQENISQHNNYLKMLSENELNKAHAGYFQSETEKNKADIADIPLKRQKLQAETEKAQAAAAGENIDTQYKTHTYSARVAQEEAKALVDVSTAQDKITEASAKAKEASIRAEMAPTEAAKAEAELKKTQYENDVAEHVSNLADAYDKAGQPMVALQIRLHKLDEYKNDTGNYAEALKKYAHNDPRFLEYSAKGFSDKEIEDKLAIEMVAAEKGGPLHYWVKKIDNNINFDPKLSKKLFATTGTGNNKVQTVQQDAEDAYLQKLIDDIPRPVIVEAQKTGELGKVTQDIADSMPGGLFHTPIGRAKIEFGLLIGSVPDSSRPNKLKDFPFSFSGM